MGKPEEFGMRERLIFQLVVIENWLKWAGIHVSRVSHDCSERITADKFMLWTGHRWGHDEVASGLGLAIQRHGQLAHCYSSSKTQFKGQFIESCFPNPPFHIRMLIFSFTQSMRLSELLWLLVFSHSVMSGSLRPYGLQRTRLPCPSPSPRVCSNSCPLSQRCHPPILFSVTPFSSCLQSFLASGAFPMSWLIASYGQSIGASASASVLPMNNQGWFLLGLTGLIALQSKGLSRIFSNAIAQKHQFFGA